MFLEVRSGDYSCLVYSVLSNYSWPPAAVCIFPSLTRCDARGCGVIANGRRPRTLKALSSAPSMVSQWWPFAAAAALSVDQHV